jgi:GNAT superfamily N-acetyltransferase
MKNTLQFVRAFVWSAAQEADFAARSDGFPIEGRAYTWGGIDEHLVALEEDSVVGHLVYGRCELRDRRGEHAVLGIGGVQVARLHTGRGIARRLLAEAGAIGRERGLACALFCPDRLVPLYSSAGYVKQSPPTWYEDPKRGRIRLQEFNLMTQPDLGLVGDRVELTGLPW